MVEGAGARPLGRRLERPCHPKFFPGPGKSHVGFVQRIDHTFKRLFFKGRVKIRIQKAVFMIIERNKSQILPVFGQFGRPESVQSGIGQKAVIGKGHHHQRRLQSFRLMHRHDADGVGIFISGNGFCLPLLIPPFQKTIDRVNTPGVLLQQQILKPLNKYI